VVRREPGGARSAPMVRVAPDISPFVPVCRAGGSLAGRRTTQPARMVVATSRW